MATVAIAVPSLTERGFLRLSGVTLASTRNATSQMSLKNIAATARCLTPALILSVIRQLSGMGFARLVLPSSMRRLTWLMLTQDFVHVDFLVTMKNTISLVRITYCQMF